MTPNSEHTKEDRISSLPHSLPVNILALPSIDSAAATSVLSRHWHHLWTHLTHLSLPPLGRSTIDHILSQLTSSKIHIFNLSFSHSLLKDATSSSFLLSMLTQICPRNPEVMNIRFDIVNPTRYFQLPACLFETQSLIHLHLAANIELNSFPHDGIFSTLPNLKRLGLFFYDSHRPLLETLFKSCPLLLEHLTLRLHLNENGHFVNISAPNLKCLELDIDNDRRSSRNCKFVIDAPKLEKVQICGPVAFYHFVMTPSSLQEAKILVEDSTYVDEYDHLDHILGILQGICCVESLVLYDCGLLPFSTLDHLDDVALLPIFHYLINLSITSDDRDWSSRVLSYLLGKLKRIEISDMIVDDNENKLLKYILSNATLLEAWSCLMFLFLTMQRLKNVNCG